MFLLLKPTFSYYYKMIIIMLCVCVCVLGVVQTRGPDSAEGSGQDKDVSEPAAA